MDIALERIAIVVKKCTAVPNQPIRLEGVVDHRELLRHVTPGEAAAHYGWELLRHFSVAELQQALANIDEDDSPSP